MISKTLFIIIPKFNSKIGQVVNGSVKEVKIVRATLKKKNVEEKYRRLNNHDAILGENENGDPRLMMYTSQERSQALLEGNIGKKDTNHMISKEDNISNNKNVTQYVSGVSIDPKPDVVKISNSIKAEAFTNRNAAKVVDHLNDHWGKKILNLCNINDKKNGE